MNRIDVNTEHHLRVLVEQLVREGRSEEEIRTAVRRANDEGGYSVRTRRLSFFR